MMERKQKKVSFKRHLPQSGLMLSNALDYYVPVGHVARLVNEAIDLYDISKVEQSYKGGGNSSYSPRLLLKGIIYAYIQKTYSSRRIEQLMRENVIMMWLCCMETIDHNTINTFRNGILKTHIEEVFGFVLGLLVERGHIKLQQMHTDGTKIEANANRYTFVWGKSVATHKGKLEAKIKLLVQDLSNEINEQEREDATDLFLNADSAVTPEVLEQQITHFKEKLAASSTSKQEDKKQADKKEKAIKKKSKS